MSFQAPIFLLGLALVPLAIAAALLARRRPARYAVRFPALPTLAAAVPRGPRWRALLPPALLCLALAGLAMALARPEATVAVPVEQASVMLVTDTSGSMNATDVRPSRLAAARDAGERFLDNVPDELQVGLVAFADAPTGVLRPTDDREAVRAALARLTAGGGTATIPRRPPSCCSPTARPRPARTPWRSRRRRAPPACPCTRWRSGRRTA
jgi:Ca-activated chloride channel family protein